MGWLIGIALVIGFIATYPAAAALIVVVGLVIWVASKANEENKKRQEEAESERKREEEKQNRYEQSQGNLRKNIEGTISSTQNIIKALPTDVEKAEYSLRRAEEEFREGVFAPFWDAIESALEHLANYNRRLRLVSQQVSDYKTNVTLYDSKPPSFPKVIVDDSGSKRVLERLNKLVRQAQKDPNFAIIYEQRQTNKILVAGFSSLGQAIYNMSSVIAQSIEDMRTSMVNAVSELRADAAENSERIIAEINDFQEQSHDDNEKAREEQKGVADALKRIAQRKRKTRF